MSYIWANDPITTSIKDYAGHITQLRNSANNERSRRLLGPYPWTDTPLSGSETDKVKTIHIEQLRTAVDEVSAIVQCSSHNTSYLNIDHGNYDTAINSGLFISFNTTVQYSDDAAAYGADRGTHYQVDNATLNGTYDITDYGTHDSTQYSGHYNNDFTYHYDGNYSSENNIDNVNEHISYDNLFKTTQYTGHLTSHDSLYYNGADIMIWGSDDSSYNASIKYDYHSDYDAGIYGSYNSGVNSSYNSSK